MWKQIGAAASVLLLGGLVFAQGGAVPDNAVKLSMSVLDKKGQPFYEELKIALKQTISVPGATFDNDMKQSFLYSWTPLGKDDKGNYQVTQQIVGIKQEMLLLGQKSSFDLRDGATPNDEMTEFLAELARTPLTFTFDPRTNKFTDISGTEELIKKMSAGDPQKEAIYRIELDKGSLIQRLAFAWEALPVQAVRQGDVWEHKTSAKLGDLGTYEITHVNTYSGRKDGLDEFTGKPSLNYRPPEKQEGTFPFEIKSGTLKVVEGSSTALFAANKGRFSNVAVKMKLEGKIQVSAQGTEGETGIIQYQEMTSTMTDEFPEAWKKK